ncbi:unnamed protein product [Cylindrotheca closterium]|uniref:DUF6824 domain-containing protein n=1 Tax=Cylindrotheca closterium TaxID=2856 RepID=A0AAD2FG05_9STRA|nr:unnamed protein product [Cylindrotheca closterium]
MNTIQGPKRRPNYSRIGDRLHGPRKHTLVFELLDYATTNPWFSSLSQEDHHPGVDCIVAPLPGIFSITCKYSDETNTTQCRERTLTGEVAEDDISRPTISPPNLRQYHHLCDEELETKNNKKLQNLEKTKKINRAKMIPGGRHCKLQDNDTVLERGSKNNQHAGSKKLLGMVRSQCQLYEIAPKIEKGRIIQDIMKGFKSSGGRFLIREDKRSNWYEALDKPVHDKLGHMLRDQARARKKTGKDKGPQKASKIPVPATF